METREQIGCQRKKTSWYRNL